MKKLLKQLNLIAFIENLEISKFDNIFLFIYSSILIFFIASNATIMSYGGLVLIFGAWLVFKGEIFVATLSYLIADTIWAINAFNNNDIEGMTFIIIGMILGLGATYKMQIGKFTKSIKTNNSIKNV